MSYLHSKDFSFESMRINKMVIWDNMNLSEIQLKEVMKDILYMLNQLLNHFWSLLTKRSNDIMLWHWWLTHLNEQLIHCLVTMSIELENDLKEQICDCESCAIDKSHHQKSSEIANWATKLLKWIHMNLSEDQKSLTLE